MCHQHSDFQVFRLSDFRADVDSSVKSTRQGCGLANKYRQPHAALDVLAFSVKAKFRLLIYFLFCVERM